MKPTQFIWDASAVAAGLNEIGQSRKELLAHLKYLLDEFHGIERPIEYYDLIAGIWLENLAHNVYSAWRELLAGTPSSDISPIPIFSSTAHAQTMAGDIGWHQHLRWAIAQILQNRPSRNWAMAQERTRIESGGPHGIARKLLRNISTAKPKVLLVQPFFKCPRQEWIGALWQWRNWAARDDMQYPISFSSNVDWVWRKKQSAEVSLPPRDFAELAKALMPLYIPVSLLEGFEEYRTAVLALSLPRPQAVYSSYALHGHLTFQMLIAEWRQEGTKLLYHQHGGGYGLEPQLTVENYEIRVSDRFYSWGWQRKGAPVYPLSPAMPAAKRKCGSRHILLNCLDLPKVPYRVMFTPMPGTIEIMHRNTCEFLTALPDHRNLIIRPFPVDYGWGAVEAMRSIAPEARFDSRRKQFSLFLACRLVVHNYLGTSWLETLGLNIPTICFYDPAVYIYREETRPLIAALQKVGILHHSGKDAARFVASLGDDIEGWWQKPEVQEARRNFVERYANFSPDWQKQWGTEFEAVLDGTH